MKTPKISIIVPVYKAEKYLHRCVDSILAQTFTDFELLLVDDGSPDESGKICDEYADKDRRVRVFHKENGGVSSARNQGIEHALGEWLYFVDSDDMLFDYTLKELYSKTSNEIDSVIGGYIETDGVNCLYKTECKKDMLWDYKTALLDFYTPLYGKFNGYLWNRLFRHSVINQYRIRFSEQIYYKEDGLFVIVFICKSQKGTAVTSKIIYQYFINSDGAMQSLKYNFNYKYLTNMDARIACWENIREVTEWNDLKLRFEARRCIVQIYYMIQGLMSYYKIKDKSVQDSIESKMKNQVSILFVIIIRIYELPIRILNKFKSILRGE